MNKKIKIQLGVIFCCIVIGAGYKSYEYYSANNTDIFPMLPSVVNNPPVNPATSPKPHVAQKYLRVPERGYIPKSIDVLARGIVADSPDPREAFDYQVVSKSYRIQSMLTLRAKEKAEQAKADYDAQMWGKKSREINKEQKRETEEDSIDTQDSKRNNLNKRAYEQKSVVYKRFNKNDITLDGFSLRAIVEENNNYVARVAYAGKNYPAQTGYTLLGKVKVANVLKNEITLTMNDESITLYMY